ncbi:MAG: Bax inhibitor-1/YccA family protein [Syntrophomonas sp.]
MSNPILNRAFDEAYPVRSRATMTLEGTITRAALLFAILVVAAGWTWNLYFTGKSVSVYLNVGLIAGFITALVIIFVRHLAPYLSPIYAACEGLALGSISALYQGLYNGIVSQAVLVTICIMGVMFFLYRTKIIRATRRFWIGVTAATFGVMLFYLIDIVLSFFNISVPYLNSGGVGGIIVSLVIIGIASLNLILDFDVIEKGVQSGQPKYMEWYAAFGLMVTLVWLYLEVLRLLSKRR